MKCRKTWNLKPCIWMSSSLFFTFLIQIHNKNKILSHQKKSPSFLPLLSPTFCSKKQYHQIKINKYSKCYSTLQTTNSISSANVWCPLHKINKNSVRTLFKNISIYIVIIPTDHIDSKTLFILHTINIPFLSYLCI